MTGMTEGPGYIQFTFPEDKVRAGETKGVKAFRVWAAKNLDSLRQAIRDQHRAASLAVLANARFQRYFTSDPGEDQYVFAERMRLEALKMHAEWAFCTYISLVNARGESEPEINFDGSDPQNIIAHLLAGNVTPALVWSAHMKPSSIRDTFRSNPSRTGMIFTARDMELKIPSEVGQDVFSLVLP